jgi:hypothetical protein
MGADERDEDLQFVTQMRDLSFQDRKVNVAQAMLHDRDDKMLLVNESDQVFMMDMHRGEVCEEWKVGEHGVDFKVRSVAPREKHAQKTTEATCIGQNRNQIFMMDQRTKNKLVSDQKITQGQSSASLTCATSNVKGQVVAGNVHGEVKFFSHLNKRAKTTLCGLGDSVLGVDVTGDGKYVLATAAAYILVIPTAHSDGKRTAFDVGLRANARPTPIKLELSHADLLRFNLRPSDLSFTRARFSPSEDLIVSSTGKLIIMWDFQKVLQGKKYQYHVKKCPHTVVVDNFCANASKDLAKVTVVEKDLVYFENATVQQ